VGSVEISVKKSTKSLALKGTAEARDFFRLTVGATEAQSSLVFL